MWATLVRDIRVPQNAFMSAYGASVLAAGTPVKFLDDEYKRTLFFIVVVGEGDNSFFVDNIFITDLRVFRGDPSPELMQKWPSAYILF